MIRLPLFSGFCAGLVLASANLSATPDELVTVSNAVSPVVGYGFDRSGDALVLTIEAGSFKADASDISVRAGLVADRTVLLQDGDAQITRENGRARFAFKIDASRLVSDAAGWKKLRAAFAVEWGSGPLGRPRQRERFLHVTPGAPHAGLSASPADWQPIDLAELEREAADRASRITFDFNQPVDGKATIVIEDAEGHRIRNLLSGQPTAKGSHRLAWDGLDEAGRIVPPGNYVWRSLSHPGLTAVHEFDFVDAQGSNHGTFHAAATNGRQVVLGTPVSEGGYQVVVLENDGALVRGFNAPHGAGLGRIAVAADDRYVYAAYDGAGWDSKTDRTKPGWKADMQITLVRFDLKTGQAADFSQKNRTAEILTYAVGPGSPGARPNRLALSGLVLLGGKLYLADDVDNKVSEIDPATGKILRSVPLESPVAIAARGDELLAIIQGGQLVRMNPADGDVKKLATLKGRPSALAAGPDGELYVSDLETQTVRVLSPKGSEKGVIGKPGGIAPGPYDPLKLKNPSGLAVVNGLVWVTERDRWQPKRYAAYDIKTGRMAREFFGPTNYGAQGAGFDYADHTRWIGQGTLFRLDFAKHTATPLSILGGEDGRRHTFWRQDGRTFVITSGKITYIQELRADGTLKPLACLSSAHQFAYENNWNPPQVFVDAFMRDYPGVKITVGQPGGIQRVQPNHGYGMLWVDRNGDSAMQADEIEFSTAAENFAGSGWSHDFHDLTLRVPATVGGKKVLVTLKPDGWWPGGAPKYPSLNDAAKAGVPIDLPGSNQVESAVDRFGDTILNSNPDMCAFAPDGRLLWTYRNQWSGVHGSHDAPLPSIGELQGALFFSGMVPLDKEADVMLLNGNHGRAFLLTSDGFYIDELFPDVRLMNNPQAGGIGILGGECFGGTFGYSEKDGNYYFQGGGIAYRIYRIDGLRETVRSRGALTVTAGQAAAAERDRLRRVVAKAQPRQTVIPFVEKPLVIDGKGNDWAGAPVAQWDRGGKFPVTVRAAVDSTRLYLHYSVSDSSPWVNNGGDWQALFKTGDGVDLQLGTDPAASPRRGSPVPGDLRLFIAPMGKQNVAVLYRHRAPEAPASEAVVFQSPWRSEKVDSVRLAEAVIAVQRYADRYEVEVSVPLAELGLDAAAGKSLHGDFGVIYGDAGGTTNIYRNYWSNQATGLVNDVPGEIMLTPNAWGDIRFAPAVAKEASK